MPNWCENSVYLKAPSEVEARAFFDATVAGADYQGVENVICTDEGEPADSIEGDSARWDEGSRAVEGQIWIEGASIEMTWSSRWEPPVAYFDAMTALGWAVTALYLEEGMQLCGVYEQGHDERTEYRRRRDVPDYIEGHFGDDRFDHAFADELLFERVFEPVVERAFNRLRLLGYRCEQDWQCCMTCGWEAIPWEDADRAVWYHAQDREIAIDHGELMLVWSGDAAVIREALEAEGLAVEHDGSKEARIRVRLAEASDAPAEA